MSAIRDRFLTSPHYQRATMAMPLPRLARSRDPGAQPLVRALRTTVLGRIEPSERRWVERIETRRAALDRDLAPTGVPEFNANDRASANGGFAMTEPLTNVGMAATMMSLAPEWCLLLMRLVRELKPKTALELCTGFGISGSYQAAALELNGRGHLTTLEGAEEWARAAVDGFDELGLAPRVDSVVGPIARTLASEAERLAPLDFVFIDAEHQTQPTLDHFETVRPHLADRAIVAFDDANWRDVRSAFKHIAKHDRVTSSVVVGRLGFVMVAGGAPRN